MLGVGLSLLDVAVRGGGSLPVPVQSLAGLSFSKVAGPTRGIAQFSTNFPISPRDTFNSGIASDKYDNFVLSGTSSVAYGGGAATFSGASAGGLALKARDVPLAPYCFAEMVVSAVSSATPFVGFAKDLNNYCWGYNQGTAIGIDAKVNGIHTNAAGAATPVVPFTLRGVINWPDMEVWLSDANGDRMLANSTLDTGVDLRTLTQFQTGWRALFGFDRSAGGSGTATSFDAGYLGAVGLRDFKPITYLNGKPYQVGSKIFFMSTCATGSEFKSNHTSVLSLDINTYVMDLTAVLFFNIAAGNPTSKVAAKDTCTSLYGGQILRDQANSQWIILPNGWGYGDATTGVQIWYATTTADLTAAYKTLALDAYQLVIPTSASLYDNAQYVDAGGTWHMVCAETDLAINWTTFNARLFSGPDLDHLSAGAHDLGHAAEGFNWARVGGAWYVTSGGVSGPHTWNSVLGGYAHFTAFDNVGGTVTASAYGTHMPIVPVNRTAGKTQYIALFFDDSEISSLGGTKGAIVVEASDQQPSGSEFG